MSDKTKKAKPICIPAGGPIDQYLPDDLKYASKEPLVPCPYDVYHRVKPSKLRGHIIKCARNHPELSICFYNATHRMPAAELSEHLRTCPSRIDVAPLSLGKTDQFLVTPASSTVGSIQPAIRLPKKPSSQISQLDVDDEDWD